MRTCSACERDTPLSSLLCEHCLSGPGSTGEWQQRPTYTIKGWGLVVVILVGMATLVLATANVLIPLLGSSLARTEDTRLAAYGLIALRTAFTLAFALAGVPFVVWLWRAVKNTTAFPLPHGDLKPGWAIGSWFIPFLGFVYPFRLMSQVVREELPGHGWNVIARLWWLGFLGNYAIGLGESYGLFGRDVPTKLAGTGSFTADPASDHVAFFTSRIPTGFVAATLILMSGIALCSLVISIGNTQTARIEARRARMLAAAAAPQQPIAVTA